MTEKKHKEQERPLNFGDLEFDEVLTDLLHIKPVENADLKKSLPSPKKTDKQGKDKFQSE